MVYAQAFVQYWVSRKRNLGTLANSEHVKPGDDIVISISNQESKLTSGQCQYGWEGISDIKTTLSVSQLLLILRLCTLEIILQSLTQ